MSYYYRDESRSEDPQLDRPERRLLKKKSRTARVSDPAPRRDTPKLIEATMGIFTRKRELNQAREEQQRLQHELDMAQQNREWEEQRRRSEQEAQRRRQEQQDWEWKRQREEEKRRQYALRMEMEELERERREKQLQEEARLAQEAERKRQEQERLQLEQKERERKLRKLKEASPETLRVLRELIHQRYELDCEIWTLRNSRRPDQPIVVQKMVESDDVMEEIMGLLSAWGDNSDRRWTSEEWVKVTEIRRRLDHDKKRVWAGNPPWNERRSTRYS